MKRFRNIMALLMLTLCFPAGAGAANAVGPEVPKVHVARGLWWNHWRIYEAIALMGGAVSDASYDVYGNPGGYHGVGAPLGDFPSSQNAIRKYDLIIIVNCRSAAIGQKRQELLAEWVREGGGLLVIGGPMAFGEGNYHGSPIEAVLPVTVSAARDMVRASSDGGVASSGSEGAPAGEMTLDDAMLIYYHTGLEVKPGARVVLTVEGKPLMILHEIGKGRVGVLAGTVCGVPGEGQVPLWETGRWPAALSASLDWLARKPETRQTASPPTPSGKEYAAGLRQLQELAEPDFNSMLDGMLDEPEPTTKTGHFPKIFDLSEKCADRAFALAVVKAVAESGTQLNAAQANRLFERINDHVEGGEFEAPGVQLAKASTPGRAALGMRVLANIHSPAANDYITRFLVRGLAALPSEGDADMMSSAMRPPDGEDEHLRIASVRAASDSADSALLPGFRDAFRKWKGSRSSNVLFEHLNEEIENGADIAMSVMGGSNAALRLVQKMVALREEIHDLTDFLEAPVWTMTPEIAKEKEMAAARKKKLLLLKAHYEAALVRLPDSVVPAFLEEDAGLDGEYAVEYLLPFARNDQIRAKVLGLISGE